MEREGTKRSKGLVLRGGYGCKNEVAGGGCKGRCGRCSAAALVAHRQSFLRARAGKLRGDDAESDGGSDGSRYRGIRTAGNVRATGDPERVSIGGLLLRADDHI